MADVIFTVTVPAGTGGGYYIDGVQKPIVSVVTSGTFRFNQNAANNNGHPLILSTTTSTAGIISTGVTYYLDGVSNQSSYLNTSLFNAATVRYIEITVAETTDFYYICNVHGSGMGNVMDVTVDSWGALGWSIGEYGDQPVNVTVNITTPGSPSNWGQFTYGEYSWGQIVGLDSELGEESIITELNAVAELSTNILNLTVGVETVTADSNLNLSTNLLQISLGDETLTGNVDLTLSTNILNTTIGAYSITADGNTSEIVVGDSINSTTGTITADAGASFIVSGNALSIAIGDESLTGNGTVTLSTNILNTTSGTISGDVATVVLTGSSVSTTSGTVTFTIDGSVAVTGVNMTTSTGRLFITAWAVVDIGVTNTWSVVDIAA
jgi:hypothetical protein